MRSAGIPSRPDSDPTVDSARNSVSAASIAASGSPSSGASSIACRCALGSTAANTRGALASRKRHSGAKASGQRDRKSAGSGTSSRRIIRKGKRRPERSWLATKCPATA
jgi:hypothetical protein